MLRGFFFFLLLLKSFDICFVQFNSGGFKVGTNKEDFFSLVRAELRFDLTSVNLVAQSTVLNHILELRGPEKGNTKAKTRKDMDG